MALQQKKKNKGFQSSKTEVHTLNPSPTKL